MPRLRTRLSVALISAVTIALELTWMRALALRFWDHFAYLIIAMALLGFGASGTALTLGRRLVAGRRRGVLAGLAVALALAMPLAARAAGVVPLNVQFFLGGLLRQSGHLLLLELIFVVPLMLAGAAVGVALMDDPERIAGHYAANLLGSGAGAAAGVALLGALTVPQAAAVLAAGAYLAGLILLPWRRAGAVVAALACGVALAGIEILLPWTPPVSQYKALPLLSRAGAETIHRASGPLGRIDVLSGDVVHYVPAGLSLVCPEPIPPHVLILLDGEPLGAVCAARSPGDFAFLDHTTWALPYRLLEAPSVLILGAGGGGDIGLARYHSARRVVAVEPNPRIVEAMAGPLASRGGRIYGAEGMVRRRDPRGFLAATSEKFDLIHVPFINVSPAGERAAREAHLYTVEAFELMLSRLAPGGMINLACEAAVPPRGGLRLLATAAEALRRTGRTPGEHLIMIRAVGTVNLTVCEAPVSPAAARAVRDFCRSRNFDLCHLPGLCAEETNVFNELRSGYYVPARGILGPGAKQFFGHHDFDVAATTDDRPFFFHFLGPARSVRMIRRLGWGHVELGYVLLVAALAQSVPLAAVLILLPLAGRAGGLRRTPGKMRALAYFMLIGLGFMLLEMNFLQRLTLYLADPIYSAAVVIGAFLVFAGVGSQLSRRWRRDAGAVVRRAGLLVAGIAAGYIFVLPRVLSATAHWPMPVRLAVAAALIAPLAMAMGQMFPVALRRLAAGGAALVPWCWAINGFASVVATVAATLLAVEIGFAAVAGIGAAAYVLAAVVGPAGRAKPSA